MTGASELIDGVDASMYPYPYIRSTGYIIDDPAANQSISCVNETNSSIISSMQLTHCRGRVGFWQVGFVSSAFTMGENQNLTYYPHMSFENVTRPTVNLSFPYLMSEINCGNAEHQYADQLNIHSCTMAVKEILKLERKAD